MILSLLSNLEPASKLLRRCITESDRYMGMTVSVPDRSPMVPCSSNVQRTVPTFRVSFSMKPMRSLCSYLSGVDHITGVSGSTAILALAPFHDDTKSGNSFLMNWENSIPEASMKTNLSSSM